MNKFDTITKKILKEEFGQYSSIQYPNTANLTFIEDAINTIKSISDHSQYGNTVIKPLKANILKQLSQLFVEVQKAMYGDGSDAASYHKGVDQNFEDEDGYQNYDPKTGKVGKWRKSKK